MPSAFTHAISAIAFGNFFEKKSEKVKLIIIGAICSILPDADVLAFRFGIPYESLWGHRGITHSFFFAAILSVFVILIFYRQISENKTLLKLFFYFFLATAFHPILDAFTNGGLGVAFFAPFENERYFFPFRPIKVSPISVEAFFTYRGWEIIKNEFVWVWLPSVLIIFTTNSLRKKSTV
jgi:inner membrane protein